MNKKIFGVQHSLLTLRILTHFLPSLKYYQNDHNIINSMNEISNLLQQNLNNLTSIEVVELLCFKSKYSLKGQGNLLQNINDQKLQSKLVQLLNENQELALRHYINIWYDSQALNFFIPKLPQVIEERIYKEPLSGGEVVLLLRCEQMKLFKKKYLNIDIIEYCIRHFEENLCYYDFMQVTQFYLLLLKIKYNYYTKQIQTPSVLFLLRRVLSENLNKMDEDNLLIILQCFQMLPNDVNPNLELKIKEFLFKQLNQQPHRISTTFIYHFLTNLESLCNSTEIELLVDVIINRLQQQTHLHSVNQANKLASWMINLCQLKLTITSRIRLTIFQEYVQQSCKIGYPLKGLTYLRYVCGINVDELINDDNLNKYPYHAYTIITNEAIKSKLHSNLIMKIKDDPIKAIIEMNNNQTAEEPFKDLLQFVVVEFFRKEFYNEKYLSQLFKLLNDQRSLILFKDQISYRKQHFQKLVMRRHQFTPLQAEMVGTLFLQKSIVLSDPNLFGCLIYLNLIPLIGLKEPQNLSEIMSSFKQFSGGFQAFAFTQYLYDNGVDYKKTLMGTQKGAALRRLYEIYNEIQNTEKRLMILYILFFN